MLVEVMVDLEGRGEGGWVVTGLWVVGRVIVVVAGGEGSGGWGMQCVEVVVVVVEREARSKKPLNRSF